MDKIDKVLIGNNGELNKKYRADADNIHSAIDGLIAADHKRGLNTSYIAIDDVQSMTAVGAPVVSQPSDQRAVKSAIDGIWVKLQPDYMVLIGSPDLIPHQELTNPVAGPNSGDPDKTVSSDLPYACNVPFSMEVADFVGPTRVVSRLPDIPGTRDPEYLIQVLETAASAKTLPREYCLSVLGVSAQKLQQSTQMSLNSVFGTKPMVNIVPPNTEAWPLSLLDSRFHFFNCHGLQNNANYFGDSSKLAHDAAYVSGKLKTGTVMATECCYGAQLYDPLSSADVRFRSPRGMANAYLGSGAYGFWGSTTFSYGSATCNAKADLICQFFLKEVLAGASLGHAALAARQLYLQQCGTPSCIDLKTVAQFIILGDASIHCVQPCWLESEVAPSITGTIDMRIARRLRRKNLLTDGTILRAFKPRVGALQSSIPATTQNQLQTICAKMDISQPSYMSYGINQPPDRPSNASEILTEYPDVTAYHLIFESQKENQLGRRVIEVAEAQGVITSVQELYSR